MGLPIFIVAAARRLLIVDRERKRPAKPLRRRKAGKQMKRPD